MEESTPPPPVRYNSKRVYMGSSSSSMDPDVVEISPPENQKSKLKSLNQKVVHHEVIDIDIDDDDIHDVMYLGEKAGSSSKGKNVLDFPDSFSNDQETESKGYNAFTAVSVENTGLPHEFQPSYDPNSDAMFYDLTNDEDDDYLYADDLSEVDEYTQVQSHFDKVNIPTGVEAHLPWFLTGNNSLNSNFQLPHNAMGQPFQMTNTMGPTYGRGAGLTFHPSGQPFQMTNNYDPHGAPISNMQMNSHVHYQPSHPSPNWLSWKENQSKIKANSAYASTMEKIKKQGMKSLHKVKQPWKFLKPHEVEMNTNPPSNLKNGHAYNYTNTPQVKIPTFTNPPLFPAPNNYNNLNIGPSSAYFPTNQKLPMEPQLIERKNLDIDEIFKKLELFKQFDSVDDYSDHHYANRRAYSTQPNKNWLKAIHRQWKILEEGLPDTILVRVYENRMDLMRAVIVGAEGTPYHDGLFFFDVFFPSGYPKDPPHVNYHSGGLRLNPNLYNCGKVCLSLLNTWNGSKNERWVPDKSTMLQVFVSIQALILNAKPFYNEPGYASMSGTEGGEIKSKHYSEDAYIKSLKTMVYTMRKPPKHFEDFILGYFYKNVAVILTACKSYMEGAQVGSLVKGEVKHDDHGKKICSEWLVMNLTILIDMLVQAFRHIGVKDCEKFLI